MAALFRLCFCQTTGGDILLRAVASATETKIAMACRNAVAGADFNSSEELKTFLEDIELRTNLQQTIEQRESTYNYFESTLKEQAWFLI